MLAAAALNVAPVASAQEDPLDKYLRNFRFDRAMDGPLVLEVTVKFTGEQYACRETAEGWRCSPRWGTGADWNGARQVEDDLNNAPGPVAAKPPGWSESDDDGKVGVLPAFQRAESGEGRWLLGVGQHPDMSLNVQVCYGSHGCEQYFVPSGSGVEVISATCPYHFTPFFTTATVKETGSNSTAVTMAP